MGKSGQGRIFISYRREETAPYAGRLYDLLSDRFGDEQIFMDVDSIALGFDFVRAINDAVASSDVLIALIGTRWLDVTDSEGKRRIDDEHDFVRLEIEAALQRDIRVIPILVDGAQLPRADYLPQGMQGLARRQALKITHEYFRSVADRLVTDLESLYPQASGKKPTASDQSEASRPALSHSVSEALKPSVDELSIAPLSLKLSIRLQQSHLMTIDATKLFSTIMVDGDLILKKFVLDGAHAFELRDGSKILQGLIEIAMGWQKISLVAIKIDGEFIYAHHG